MTDAADTDVTAEKKSSKLPLIIGLVLALVGGSGGFYAVSSGMILSSGPKEAKEKELQEESDAKPDTSVAFVPMDPLTISLPPNSASDFLRFRAELEVPKKHQVEVESVMPRIVDVMNSYLRALEARDLEQPAALARLRAQILRRVQVVAGADHINDVLIMEFVLN